MVSRLGIGAGYGVPTTAVERAYHERGVNYLYWGTRRDGMRDAIRHLARTERERLVIALQTYDHLGFYLPRSVENGLRALGIDRADVLILGWFTHDPSRRVMDAAMRLKDQGKVRFLAVSGHRRSFFAELAQRPNSPIDIFMCRYNAAHRGAEREIFPFLPEQDRPGITVYTATCWRKLLTAKKMPPNEPPLRASDCYRFVLAHPSVDLCMVGPANDDQMSEALSTFDRGPLTEQELERIRRIGDFVRG